MSSADSRADAPMPRQRRSRKSIAHMPSPEKPSMIVEKEDMTADLSSFTAPRGKTSRKSRSKSIGPGGLNEASGNRIKVHMFHLLAALDNMKGVDALTQFQSPSHLSALSLYCCHPFHYHHSRKSRHMLRLAKSRTMTINLPLIPLGKLKAKTDSIQISRPSFEMTDCRKLRLQSAVSRTYRTPSGPRRRMR